MRDESACLKAALRYAGRGWGVFPLNEKRPFPGTHGYLDATTDAKQIRWWFRRWPDANVGIACSSEHGPIVIDIDGASGEPLADDLALPSTREASSRRKGRRHLYFDPPVSGAKVPRSIRPGGKEIALDILGDGGYVVAPPSLHPVTNRRYVWTLKVECAPLPESVVKFLKTKDKTKKQADPMPEVIGEGRRDELLTSLAGTMRRRNASQDAILAALREENALRCDPPLDDRQLRKIAKSIATKAPAGQGEHLTDLGNARRFVEQHATDTRALNGKTRSWLIWEGPRWSPDDTGEAERKAKDTVRALYSEASATGDEIERDAILKHAAKSEQSSRIRGLLELAATEPEIALTHESLDQDPWLFNVENGTIDLRTGKLRSHRREDLITKLAPVEFDPKATWPRWNKFLHEIMDGDGELVEFLERAVGYSMTGDTREHCLFFGYGKGRNGKSTFLEVLRELMGGYAQQSDFTTFQARRNEGPRTDIARMRGARLITAIEADGEKGFDGTILKQLTGGDTVVARRLYEHEVEFKPTHKLWLAANHKPIVREQTEGFWSRLRLIPFTVIFPPEKRDKKLAARLIRTELPGILNWAIRGAIKWRTEGLIEPKAIKRATIMYREENDTLGEFMAQRCVIGMDGWTSTPELYRAFGEWWMETRGNKNPMSMGWFGRLLGERIELKPTKMNRLRGWRGIAVKQEMNA